MLIEIIQILFFGCYITVIPFVVVGMMHRTERLAREELQEKPILLTLDKDGRLIDFHSKRRLGFYRESTIRHGLHVPVTYEVNGYLVHLDHGMKFIA